MSNCGCTDTTPCTSQECGCKFEVDAGCVRYTGDTLSCIDAQTGDLLSDILLELDAKFCSLVEGNFIEVSQEVAGANCEVGGLKIVVKNINTLAVINTEYLCGTSYGSGTVDYVTRWTPDGSTLGNSIIRDNGTTASIGTAPASTNLLTLVGSYDSVVHSTNNKNGAFGAILGNTLGAGAGTNYGSFFAASNSTTLNVGTFSSAISIVAGTNVGLQALANNATTANYAIQLQDPSVGVGKVLTCMTATGHASWQTLSSGTVLGSGTLNYIPRWTPDGVTLGDSTIRDNGTTASIGVAPNSSIQLYIVSTLATGIYYTSTSTATSVQGIGSILTGAGTNNRGFYSQVTNGTATNIGGQFTSGGPDTGTLVSTDIGVKATARNTTRKNIGAFTEAVGANSGTNIGILGFAANGSSNYAAAFVDGTEGVGKVLTCMTTDGEAQWATPSSTGMTWITLTGVSPTAAMLPNKGYLIINTSGSSTGVTLPAFGTCSVGDYIKINATGELASSLATWTITAGNSGDKIYGNFSQPDNVGVYEGVKNGPGVLFTFNGTTNSATNYKKTALTLQCVYSTGSAYHWHLVESTNWVLS